MGLNWTEGCYRNSTLTETAFAVLIAIARRADRESGECWPSLALLAAESRWNERTVRRALKAIESSGEAEIIRGNGKGHPTRYRLNPDLLKGDTVTPFPVQRGTQSPPLATQRGTQSQKTGGQRGTESPLQTVDTLYMNLSEEKEPVKDICPPKVVKEDDRFDEFWTTYPRKEGKKKARDTWVNLPKKDRAAALAKLPDFLPAYASTEPQFIPHPNTWLNQRRWEDNPPPVKTTQLAPSKAVRNQFRDPAVPRRTNVIIDAQWRTQ